MKRADVRMAERGDNTRFAFEALAVFDVGGKPFRQHLDRYRAVQTGITCLVDFAHPAAAGGVDNFVRAEARAGDQRRFVSPASVYTPAACWFTARSEPLHCVNS